MSLMMQLMVEASRRCGSEPTRPILDDAGHQGRHGMDAPDTVDDGVEWYTDEQFPDCCGPIPRSIPLREA